MWNSVNVMGGRGGIMWMFVRLLHCAKPLIIYKTISPCHRFVMVHIYVVQFLDRHIHLHTYLSHGS